MVTNLCEHAKDHWIVFPFGNMHFLLINYILIKIVSTFIVCVGGVFWKRNALVIVDKKKDAYRMLVLMSFWLSLHVLSQAWENTVHFLFPLENNTVTNKPRGVFYYFLWHILNHSNQQSRLTTKVSTGVLSMEAYLRINDIEIKQIN